MKKKGLNYLMHVARENTISKSRDLQQRCSDFRCFKLCPVSEGAHLLEAEIEWC